MSDNCRDLFFTETTATALGTYSAYIGDGVNTTYNITHNLNSEEVTYSLRDVQTDVLGYAQVNVTGPNTVTISFDDPPALTAFYLTIFASITAKQVTGFEDRITVNVTQPVQDISVNVADTSDVILVSPEQDVITISTSVQSAPGVTIDVGVVDTQEQINVAVDTAATAWGTIIGTLSTQTDLWRYLSAETFSPSQLTALLNSNAISLCSINVNGTILSAGTDLFDIFLTSETDSQTLSYIASSYLLSISNGNTVNLSSINSVFAANSGKYESVYSNVQSNSANWNSATTVVQQGSSNWYSASSSAISYTHQNFLPLSGGTIAGSLYVLSSVYVAGSAFYINAQDLIVSDPIVYIAEGNQTDFLDIGIIASWTNPPGYPVGYQHGGLIRRSDNKTWTLFSGASSEPLSGLNVEWSQQGIVLEPLSAKFYGDIYGNRFVYGSLSATGSVFGSNLNISNWNQAYNTATVYQTNSATYAPKVELRSHSMFSSGDYAVQQGRNVELSFSANASNTNITITLPRQDSNDNAQTGDELLIRLSSINPINSTVTIRQYTFTGSLPYPGTFTNLITFPAGTPSQTIRLRLGTFIWALLPTPNLFSPTQIGLITPNTGTFTTLSATGVVHASGGNSNLWNSAYNISTAYQSASGNWQGTFTTVQNNSANWESTYALVCGISANWVLDGGNTKGADITVGTNDTFALRLETNDITRLSLLSSGLITIAGSVSGLANPTTSFNSGSATGNLSFAIGNARAFGQRAFAQGNNTIASGSNTAAFGSASQATGTTSFAKGTSTQATNTNSSAEGSSTVASGQASHAEGNSTTAGPGNNSHAEGLRTTASGAQSHAEGTDSRALGINSHAEGDNALAQGNRSHAEGLDTQATGDNSHAEGDATQATNTNAHAEGFETIASGQHSHSQNLRTQATGNMSHAGGRNSIAQGNISFVHGNESRADGEKSFAIGETVHAMGSSSIAMGVCAIAAHDNSFIWSGIGSPVVPISTTCVGQFYIKPDCGVYIDGDLTVTGTLNGTVAGGGGVASYSTLIGNGVLSSFTVIHNLSTLNVQTQVFDTSNNTVVYPLVQVPDVSSVNVFFEFVPSPSAYKVLVFGGSGTGSSGGGGGTVDTSKGDTAFTIVQVNSASWGSNIYVPTSADFVYRTNYQKWIRGTDQAAFIYNIDKWSYAELSGGEFKLEFIGGTINNKPIPKSQIGASVIVNADTIVYRNDGYGLQPANYVDLFNSILSSNNLYTRISATSGISAPDYYDSFIIRLNTAETFDFSFKETEIAGGGGMTTPQYYRIYVEPPYRIFDQITLFGYQGGSDFATVWNDYTP